MNHKEARAIVEAAWRRLHGREPTEREAAYAQAIAWFETRYGRASGQFQKLAAEGKFNWGALHAKGTPPNCPPGSAEGVDVRPVCFLVFPDDVSAATAYLRVLTKQHWQVIEAMRGTPEDVARAMRKPPAYYEGRAGLSEDQKISEYAAGIRRSLDEIAREVPVPSVGVPSSKVVLWAVIGAGAFAWYRYAGGDRVIGKLVHSARRLLPSG